MSDDFRTLPSRTYATGSFRAMSAIFVSLPLYANDEVRAITFRSGSFTSKFSTSSLKPSEKYSCSGSELIFTKGSTAIDASVASAVAAGGGGEVTIDVSVSRWKYQKTPTPSRNNAVRIAVSLQIGR